MNEQLLALLVQAIMVCATGIVLLGLANLGLHFYTQMLIKLRNMRADGDL